MNPIAVIFTAAIPLAATACLMLAWAAARAGDGYEDETGFHPGLPPSTPPALIPQRRALRTARIARPKPSRLPEPAGVG